jgi:non-lysosomal glucosylceramidase
MPERKRNKDQARLDRRDFVKTVGLAAPALAARPEQQQPAEHSLRDSLPKDGWPVLRAYDRDHLARIALPLGGIGTGTVSLGGRGDLRDWEIMNRPAKGFVPLMGQIGPFFALFVTDGQGWKESRIVEGPIEYFEYEGSHGSPSVNENFPRFHDCAFFAAYPFARVVLSGPGLPFEVHLKAFNPLVPADMDASSIPAAILRYEVHNRSVRPLSATICGSLPNFIGIDGGSVECDWKGDAVPKGARGNRNEFRNANGRSGIFMSSQGVEPESPQSGTISLTVPASEGISYRTGWAPDEWGTSVLDFWDDFSADGRLEERQGSRTDTPMASLAVPVRIPPQETRSVTFLLTWHFPNRYSWTSSQPSPAPEDRIGNYYTQVYSDAWDVAEKTARHLDQLEARTRDFVQDFLGSSLPREVLEAGLFNLSTLRTQTCFRLPDGHFFGFEGTGDKTGCCHGSCTHVWNYEQATPHLFGDLALSMRDIEFGYATDDQGLMNFRVNLPLSRAQEFGKAAADGQMGCIMKTYRDWQLSGKDDALRRLWPKVRKALEFCWIPDGWDADQDGVMEGCQHNTMDVEYYGPNPQMGTWYLGALRAAEEMARHVDDNPFAETCRRLFEKGSQWIDDNLFNGEYYEQQVRPISDPSKIAPGLVVGAGAKNPAAPDRQLGPGCLVDQLVGQYMAHVCGLGYLLKPENVRKALASVLKYNWRSELNEHFNCLRTFAMADESGLLMASYPKGRPPNPFPYFTEVMTGFEYTAAIGMLYEGMKAEGLACIRAVRERYDGRKRNPFDEAECGHHYARAMASWAAILALTGFHYSGVTGVLTFSPVKGRFFWSNGWAWGTCDLVQLGSNMNGSLEVKFGRIRISRLRLRGFGESDPLPLATLVAGQKVVLEVRRKEVTG